MEREKEVKEVVESMIKAWKESARLYRMMYEQVKEEHLRTVADCRRLEYTINELRTQLGLEKITSKYA